MRRRENFLRKIGGRQVEIIGQISFKGAAEREEPIKLIYNFDELKKEPLKPEDFQIFLDGAEISFDALKKVLDGTADYIVFEQTEELFRRAQELYAIGFEEKFITMEALQKYARDNFYSVKNARILVATFSQLKVSRLLDVDNFFAKNDFFYTWFNHSVAIEAVDVDSFAKKYPIVGNVYNKIYTSLNECRLKKYDAIIVTAERTLEEFFDLMIETNDMAENILVFVRKNSSLNSLIEEHKIIFDKIGVINAVNGSWFFLKKRVSPEDFCIYVVTHKDVKLSKLPEGYKIIHAGHAVAKEKFGYLGDDTGNNISTINRYLNEITALYWMWTNTQHTIIGMCHYRRFFTLRGDWNPETVNQKTLEFNTKKILTATEAKNILRDYDMIVVKGHFFLYTQTEVKSLVICQEGFSKYIEDVFRKHIQLKQPDYLDAFDYVSSSYSEFLYEMFITRRSIFNAYCEWLFSFIIHVTAEVLETSNLEKIDNPRIYRAIGLVAERLMTVWLMKNNLRLKALPVMFRENI